MGVRAAFLAACGSTGRSSLLIVGEMYYCEAAPINCFIRFYFFRIRTRPENARPVESLY